MLAGCNGSTKGCREPYRERKGILGISWRIESFKLIFPKYDDCRNPGIIAEDDWKLFLFDGVKNAGAELDYDLIEPQLPAGSPRPFSISEYEFEPGDFTALRLDNVCAKPGVRYCIEFKRKGSRPKATRVRVYLIVTKTITIAGISHTVGEGDTKNWEGTPGADGQCVVSLNDDNSVKFTWSGGKGSGVKNYPFNIKAENLQVPLQSSGVLNGLNTNYEFDSRCKESSENRVNKIKDHIENDSLLRHGTWAYLKRPGTQDSYLFWTSVDTDKVGADQTIPVLINVGNKFYISQTTTATRNPGSKTNEYVAISKHLYSSNDFKSILENRQEYSTLEAAYNAYEQLLTENKQYEKYKDTLPKS